MKKKYFGWGILVVAVVLMAFLFRNQTGTAKVDDLSRREQILKMYRQYKQSSFLRANDLTVREILSLEKENKVVFVDVRRKEEQDISMIPEAIPYREFERNKTRYKDTIVIPYCTIGSRSGQYTEELMKEGFEAYNMIGSILMWAHEGQPLINQGNPTNRAHVYGPKWDLLPEGYISVIKK